MVESTFVFYNANEQTDYMSFQYLRGLRNKILRFGGNDEEKRNAVVQKNGQYKLMYSGLKEMKKSFVKDLYTTLLDLKWIYLMAIVCNVYVIAYLVFAVIWWLNAYAHGDFDNLDNSDWEPCLKGVSGFGGALLFSIETQTTIGYGNQYPDPTCFFTLPLIFVQILIGFLCETILLGLIFTKFSRPSNRGNTIVFSRRACIYRRNHEMFLQVRVGDLRQSHLLSSGVQGMLIRRYVTDEGYLYPLYQRKVEFEAHGMAGCANLIWPMILTHKINKESPLWDIQPPESSLEKFELLVFVEGTVESTGETCQTRTSFTPNEILWGHKFDTIEDFDEGVGRWHVNFAAFNDTIFCSNLRHSAKELDDFDSRGILESSSCSASPPLSDRTVISTLQRYTHVTSSDDDSNEDTFSMEAYDFNSDEIDSD